MRNKQIFMLAAVLLAILIGWQATPITYAEVGNGWEASPLRTTQYVTITGNGSRSVSIGYRNDGFNTWYSSGVSLNYRYVTGDYPPNSNGNSSFSCANWFESYRPTYVSSTTYQGGTGYFNFSFCNSNNLPAGTYRETYDIAHGEDWFYWDTPSKRVTVYITVEDQTPPTPTRTPTPRPTSPPTFTPTPRVTTPPTLTPTPPPSGDPWSAALAGGLTFDVYLEGNSDISENITARYSNNGTNAWSSGAAPVVLSYRYEPGDSSRNNNQIESAFRCNAWPSENNYWAAKVSPSSVSPGQTGSFTFPFCNTYNQPPGTYIEHFDIAHGGEWFYGGGWAGKVTVRIHVQNTTPSTPTNTPTPSFEAQWDSQLYAGDENGPFVELRTDEQSETLWVRFINTGTATWTADNVMLKPQPRAAGEAPNATFACNDTDAIASLVNGPVAPGQTGEFRLKLCGNDRAVGEYVHAVDFGLWAESQADFMNNPTNGNPWGKANAWWNVVVVAPTLEDLIDLVNEFCDNGQIYGKGNLCHSLLVKLENAIDTRDRGQPDVACNQVGAFINEVEAKRDKHPNGIEPAAADELIALAHAVCEAPPEEPGEYGAEWIDQTGFNQHNEYIVDINLGTSKDMSVIFKNAGDQIWQKGEVVLAVYEPFNPPPDMCNSSNNYPNVYAYADFDTWLNLDEGFVVELDEDIAPGQLGVFDFKLRANQSEYPHNVNDIPCDVHFILLYKEGNDWIEMPNPINGEPVTNYATAWWAIKDDPNIPCSGERDYEVCVARSEVWRDFPLIGDTFLGYHAFIVIQTNHPEEFGEFQDRFQQQIDGNWTLTIGASPEGNSCRPEENAVLMSRPDGDMNHVNNDWYNPKSITLPPFMEETGQDITDLIRNLLKVETLYDNNNPVPYAIRPGEMTQFPGYCDDDGIGYNSNSFVRSVMRLAGIGGAYDENIETNNKTPGWYDDVFKSLEYAGDQNTYGKLCPKDGEPHLINSEDYAGNIAKPEFNAKWIAQSASQIASSAGEEAIGVTVQMQNVGSNYWCDKGFYWVTFNVFKAPHIQTAPESIRHEYENINYTGDNPDKFGTSFFEHNSWPVPYWRDNPPVQKYSAAVAREGIVAPGEIATYEIPFYFPKLPYCTFEVNYREDFTLAVGAPGGFWIRATAGGGRDDMNEDWPPIANVWLDLIYILAPLDDGLPYICIASEGGSFQLAPTTTLIIDAGTFNDTVTFNYTPLSQPTSDAAVSSASEASIPPTDLFNEIDFFYDLSATYPDGTAAHPLKPYTITLTYDQANVPDGINEADLALYHWNGSEWVKEASSVVDVEANTITATPDHFSLWGVLVESPPETTKFYFPLILKP